MKKGGFTIIELIVSIALISMLSTILAVVIIKKMREVKDTTYNVLMESIQIAAEDYATNNEALLTSYAENDWVKIPLSTLIENNYFEEELTNPKTKKELPITDNVYVTRNYKGKIESFYNINQNTSPKITLNGRFNMYIKLNSTFTDPGVTAFDSNGSDVTNIVTKTGSVDTSKNGTYVIYYKYKTTTITRNIIVGDKKTDGSVWYTLSINPNGGYFNGSNEITLYNLKEGRNQDVSDVIKVGNDFGSWNYTCTGCTITDGIFKMGTSNASLVAVWNPLPKLTVELNGGTTTQVFSTYYHQGDEIQLINPSKTSNMFKFWSFTGAEAQLNGDIFKIGTADATITANWLAYSGMYTYTGSSTVVDDGNGNWRIKFLTSGTLTPLIDMTVDAFLVGGGGAGGISADNGLKSGGGGGAGGYTGTYSGITLSANTPYIITIGAGGIHSTAASGYGGTGGTTSAFGYSKAGGTGGYGYMGDANTHTGGTGGSNGGAGRCGTGYAGNSYGSAAQGSTTCEFGEGTTTSCTKGDSYAYAGGGGGGGGNGGGGGAGGIAGAGSGAGVGGCYGGSGISNTGGGGGGAYSKGTCYGGDGGSGILIIRNHI